MAIAPDRAGVRSTMSHLISVVGLGPGDPGCRTLATQEALSGASRIVLRTSIHPGINDLIADPRVVSCDDLYERSPRFDQTYHAIATRVLETAESTDVVYAVPGHPLLGETSVAYLIDDARHRGVSLRVIPAVSALDSIAVALGLDLFANQVQVLDGAWLSELTHTDPFASGQLAIDPHRPSLIVQVYSQAIATGIKLTLARLLTEDHPVVIVRSSGIGSVQQIERCRLFELDRRSVDHLTSVWIPEIDELDGQRSTAGLQRIVALLRAPDGCPWDREQTHQSLRQPLLDEAFETADAIDNNDPDNLVEELGDLLLHVIMHSQIAEEHGAFIFEDVVGHLHRKLVRRHPHVFGSTRAETPEDIERIWDDVKTTERLEAGKPPQPSGVLARLPRSMPALSRAQRVFCPAPPSAEVSAADARVGDDLLDLVRSAAALGVDAEGALTRALSRVVSTDEIVAIRPKEY